MLFLWDWEIANLIFSIEKSYTQFVSCLQWTNAAWIHSEEYKWLEKWKVITLTEYLLNTQNCSKHLNALCYSSFPLRQYRTYYYVPLIDEELRHKRWVTWPVTQLGINISLSSESAIVTTLLSWWDDHVGGLFTQLSTLTEF